MGWASGICSSRRDTTSPTCLSTSCSTRLNLVNWGCWVLASPEVPVPVLHPGWGYELEGLIGSRNVRINTYLCNQIQYDLLLTTIDPSFQSTRPHTNKQTLRPLRSRFSTLESTLYAILSSTLLSTLRHPLSSTPSFKLYAALSSTLYATLQDLRSTPLSKLYVLCRTDNPLSPRTLHEHPISVTSSIVSGALWLVDSSEATEGGVVDIVNWESGRRSDVWKMGADGALKKGKVRRK